MNAEIRELLIRDFLAGRFPACPNSAEWPPVHTSACYRMEVHPCPGCGVSVRQSRSFCGVSVVPLLHCTACSLACRDCTSEVLTSDGRNYRVVHSGTCLWLVKYQAGEVHSMVPCGARVTHRGPYRRRPR